MPQQGDHACNYDARVSQTGQLLTRRLLARPVLLCRLSSAMTYSASTTRWKPAVPDIGRSIMVCGAIGITSLPSVAHRSASKSEHDSCRTIQADNRNVPHRQPQSGCSLVRHLINAHDLLHCPTDETYVAVHKHRVLCPAQRAAGSRNRVTWNADVVT